MRVLVTTPARPRHAPLRLRLSKVVVVGDLYVGKTSLIHRCAAGHPLPPSTAVRPAWEAQSQVTAETVWPLGGGRNRGDSRRAESVAWEPGDGQAVPCPCRRAWASPHPAPHLQPLAAAASATELLLAAPSACGPSCGPPPPGLPRAGFPWACSLPHVASDSFPGPTGSARMSSDHDYKATIGGGSRDRAL